MEKALEIGTTVKMRDSISTKTAVITKKGVNPKVYYVEPPLGGRGWHCSETVEEA